MSGIRRDAAIKAKLELLELAAMEFGATVRKGETWTARDRAAADLLFAAREYEAALSAPRGRKR